MYYVEKHLEISAAHALALGYESPCRHLHGHNWHVVVCCRARELDASGMVVDFKRIKEAVHGALDHRNLNDVLPCNPTAENIARWIAERLGPKCWRVSVQESGGNLAVWEAD